MHSLVRICKAIVAQPFGPPRQHDKHRLAASHGHEAEIKLPSEHDCSFVVYQSIDWIRFGQVRSDDEAVPVQSSQDLIERVHDPHVIVKIQNLLSVENLKYVREGTGFDSRTEALHVIPKGKLQITEIHEGLQLICGDYMQPRWRGVQNLFCERCTFCPRGTVVGNNPNKAAVVWVVDADVFEEDLDETKVIESGNGKNAILRRWVELFGLAAP
mmetsp:Transcript_20011/g.53487  ORF Transcript_20011/g.53487 Transcript_20011/m.53487 type:complete len:214 (-) Transcript_20011:158-799(-)